MSQRGALFYTGETFSTVRDIKNTLVVPTAVEGGGNGRRRGKRGAGDSSNVGQGAAQLRIAMTGRTLRDFNHNRLPQQQQHQQQPLGDAVFLEPEPKFPSREWFTSFAFLDVSSTGPSSPSSRAAAMRGRAVAAAAAASNRKQQPELPSTFSRRKWWFAVMPDGFPYSVRDSQGYARFFALNIMGCFCAAFSLTLATQALLSSFFTSGTSVGWLLKDIAPAFLTAYLAHQFITVERHPREWFIVANVLTQSAVCFDFAIPHIAAAVGDPKMLLVPLATLSSFAKGLAMLILTTSRTALVQSFSREGNLVELTKRLHGMLIVTYPTASGVALAVVALFSLSGVSIAALVCVSSLACIAVSVSMVRRIYPRLLNTECAVESCRRFMNGHPVIRCAEAPSVALFHRNVFNVPFLVGFSIPKAAAAARKESAELCVVRFAPDHDGKAPKYLMVFRRYQRAAAGQQRKRMEVAAAASSSSSSSHPRGAVKPTIPRKGVTGAAAADSIAKSFVSVDDDDDAGDNSNSHADGGDEDLSPKNFVGIVYDVGATFTDVMEGVYAALAFVEPVPTTTTTTAASSSFSQQGPDGDVVFNHHGGNNGYPPLHHASSSFTGDHPPERVFLKRPRTADVSSLVHHMQGAGWQVRAHQIDNRDYRVEISAMPQSNISVSSTGIADGPLSPSSSSAAAASASANDESSEAAGYVSSFLDGAEKKSSKKLSKTKKS